MVLDVPKLKNLRVSIEIGRKKKEVQSFGVSVDIPI